MAVQPFIHVANAIINQQTDNFLPEYVAAPNNPGHTVNYVSGTYYSSLATSNAPGGYEYFQQWSSNPGYDNGILLRSNDGPYQNGIYGGSGDDTILGNSGVDGIVGRDGNDLIMGAGGDDSLMGLSGDDTIVAGYSMVANSDSFLNTWRGLFSDPDMTDAQVAAQFNARTGNAALYGGDGNDLLVSGGGDDKLHGGNGDDIIFGGAGVDIIYGETGAGAFGYTEGQTGNDTIAAGLGDDEVHGGAGDDVILGEEGIDELYGDDGGDTIYGGTGRDEIYGGAGRDEILGGADGDMIDGGIDGDLLNGEAGDDIILGGDGDDQIHGGAGNDIVQGGAGNDKFVLSTGYEVTRIVGQANDGADIVILTSDITGINVGQSGTNLIIASSNGTDGVIIADWFTNQCVEYLGVQATGKIYNISDIVASIPAASAAPQAALSMAADSNTGLADLLYSATDFVGMQTTDIELLGISPVGFDADMMV